jgi:hypothetical protein
VGCDRDHVLGLRLFHLFDAVGERVGIAQRALENVFALSDQPAAEVVEAVVGAAAVRDVRCPP